MFLALLILCCLAIVVQGKDPDFITWPSRWHSSVSLADASLLQSAYIPISGSGSYYYDSTSSSAVFVMTSPTTGRTIREVVNGNNDTVDIIDGPTQSCLKTSATTASRFQVLPPDFLSQGKFKFVTIEYYLRNGVFFETYHWVGRYPSNSPTQIDYWHTVETNAPFRLSWGAVLPIVLEFSNVMAGLDDVANAAYMFSSPTTCSSNISKTLPFLNASKHIKATKPAIFNEELKSSGNAWPVQWHANSYYTGNNFGLSGGIDVIGEPTVVPISLFGQYYYDWPNLRECNVWTDAVSGVRTKTLIVNGTFHLVTLATNSCLIVPTSPVNGPLKYEWPTSLNYLDEQLLLPPLVATPASYAYSQHFYYDAFLAGLEHSFHYWQTADTQVPLQFQGPVLEFPPYGQSMMAWSQFEIGLSGVDLEDVFSLPSVCKNVGPTDDEYKLLIWNPLVRLHMALETVKGR